MVSFILTWPLSEFKKGMVMATQKKSRGWLTICYPENGNIMLIRDLLSKIGQMAIISPLHDKDINQGTEELKKGHYHVLLLWEGPTTEKNAKGVVNLINGVGCIQCMSVRGSVRYFLHLDNPDKYQYDKKDLTQIGGLDLDKMLLSDSDESLMLSEIFKFIGENEICNYRRFIDYCMIEREDWFNLIMHKHRENVWKYIRSMEYELKGLYIDE